MPSFRAASRPSFAMQSNRYSINVSAIRTLDGCAGTATERSAATAAWLSFVACSSDLSAPCCWRLSPIVRVVCQVQEQRGIVLVLLSSTGESDAHSASPASALQHSTQEVDKLAVLANHQALMGVATDISQTRTQTGIQREADHNQGGTADPRGPDQRHSSSSAPFMIVVGCVRVRVRVRVCWCVVVVSVGAQNDSPNSVILRSRRTTLILLRVERASLIVVFKNSVDATLCLQHIERTADLVRKGRRTR